MKDNTGRATLDALLKIQNDCIKTKIQIDRTLHDVGIIIRDTVTSIEINESLEMNVCKTLVKRISELGSKE